MVIILFGADNFRKKEKLEEIKNKFKEKTGGEILKFSQDVNFKELKEKIFSRDIFLKRKMIILENFSKSKDFPQIIPLLEKMEKDRDLVIVFLEEEIPEELKELKYVYEFKPLTNEKLKNWIRKKVLKEGGKISPAAVTLLIDYIGNDLFRMNNEINKLVAYCQKKTITPKEVNFLLEAKIEEDVFQLVDALANKNKKRTIKLLEGQFRKGISPTHLLNLLLKQFKLLLQIKEGNFSGPGFLFSKLFSQAKKYNLEEIKKIYQKLLKIDLKIKTTPIKPEVFFDLFIAEV